MSSVPEFDLLFPLQTMRRSFEQICQGKYPWEAIRSFMSEWYEGRSNLHPEMVTEPLPQNYPEQYRPWASVCAATVEWFCNKYELTCPQWVFDAQYILPNPWFSEGKPASLSLHEEIVQSTPEEFIRRNIYCGDEVSANKWAGFEELQDYLTRIRTQRKATQARG